MRIGIDIDEVLADSLSAIINFHNDTYDTALTRNQFHSYRFWEIWGGTMDEAIKKIYDFHRTPYFQNILPVSGAQDGVKALKDKHDLYIVTSREADIIDDTKHWIEQYFPNMFTDIHFANHYYQNGNPLTKKSICDAINLDLLIDDSHDLALECHNQNRKILLYDCPWNQSDNLPDGIHRVYSWPEIIQSELI